MRPNSSQLSAISRLFSSAVFREMAKEGRSALFARLFVQSGISHERVLGGTVGDAFNAAFAVLRRCGLRDEYVYRAALTHNVLLGTHSLSTASMLTEFRAGRCKADVAILNGTATVYEIKSERDSLARLANQVLNYRKVFAKVYVIAGEAHVSEVLRSVPDDIGVMSLVRWDRIKTEREAVDRPELVCPVTIFDSLRIAEARDILYDLKIPIPDLPNTQMHNAMRHIFGSLAPTDVHTLMVKTLKRTRNLTPMKVLVDRLPVALQPAALSIQVRKSDHTRLVAAVNTSIVSAMSWT